MDAVIRLNDPTSHGGKVISAQPGFTAHGIQIACEGDMVICPQCKGVYPILNASHSVSFRGKKIAVAGMKTACGAVLISTQSSIKV